MGWSDPPSDLAISIATRLSDPGDLARFRAVCKSWESASRGIRPSTIFFPWLAVVRGEYDRKRSELSFISHASNDRIYKLPIPRRRQINMPESYWSSNKDGWMMFVRFNFGIVPIIVNPLTGAKLQNLPPLQTLRRRRRCKVIDFVVFLTDNLVALVEWCYDDDENIIAAATPGDKEWSYIRARAISWSRWRKNRVRSVVFHEADRKFYVLYSQGDMESFCLTRCVCGRKTIFSKVSYIKAKTTQEEALLFDSHLVSDGTNLLRVTRRRRTKEFDIFKYCPDDEDMWMQVIDMDYLGNNALFFDNYGDRLLPLPQSEEGRSRRNHIYFTDYDSIPLPHEGANQEEGKYGANDTKPKEEEKEEEEEEEGGYFHKCNQCTVEEEEEDLDYSCRGYEGVEEVEERGYQYVHYVRIYDVDKGTVEPCFSTNIQSDNILVPALMWFKPSLYVKN